MTVIKTKKKQKSFITKNSGKIYSLFLCTKVQHKTDHRRGGGGGGVKGRKETIKLMKMRFF